MKMLAWLLLIAPAVCVVQVANAQSSFDLRSPNNHIEVRIRTAGQIRYDVVLNGTALLENATLSMDIDHKKFGIDPKVVNAKPSSHYQVVEPVVRQKFATIRDHYNELRLTLDGGY